MPLKTCRVLADVPIFPLTTSNQNAPFKKPRFFSGIQPPLVFLPEAMLPPNHPSCQHNATSQFQIGD
ncbi:hypothetical protein TNCV_529611 [Trichonephila clavipes]|nr:hypothetical protein TNCV_529611 [Trichonephila clavipes]